MATAQASAQLSLSRRVFFLPGSLVFKAQPERSGQVHQLWVTKGCTGHLAASSPAEG